MSPMFKQKVGMTEIYAKGIAELFLIRCNPYHWDGSGEVPDNISFDVYKRKIDETYDGCTLEIQLCKPDGCLCYAASVHLYEGGFWTGHGIGCFDKTAICNDPGSVDALTSAITRVCMTYEIKKYTDDGKEQNEIEFESVIFADGMHMDVRCIPRHNGPSWCEAAIYREDEDIVTSEPSNSFYNHWVCQTANATYHLYMGIADE